MQFGKIHGIALIVLGLVLIAVQVDFAFADRSKVAERSQPSPTEFQPPKSHHLGPIAGILGAASFVGGIAIFATARRRDEPAADHAVK